MTVKNTELLPMFLQVKRLLEPYEGRFVARRDEPGYYDLWTQRPVVIDGRRRKDVFFAGLIVQKSYVGFYFMPLYADQQLSRVFGSDLLARLKGKSCFHLKELTPALATQIEDALSAGFELYVERDWV